MKEEPTRLRPHGDAVCPLRPVASYIGVRPGLRVSSLAVLRGDEPLPALAVHHPSILQKGVHLLGVAKIKLLCHLRRGVGVRRSQHVIHVLHLRGLLPKLCRLLLDSSLGDLQLLLGDY